MKKLGIICMILLFSMGTMGMGYAGWYDVISAKYDVATGTVSAGIRNHGVNDYGPDPCSHGGPNPKGKDIGYAHCQDGPYEYELEGTPYSENVKVDIYGYRSYAPVFTLEMANCGSIPVKVDQLMIDWDGELADNIQVGKWSVDCPDGYRQSGQGLTSLRNTIRYVCLDPGQKMWLDLEFQVGGKKDRKDSLEVINEALRTVLKDKTAEASEIDEVSSDDAERNSTESASASEGASQTEDSAPDSESATNNAPVPDILSSSAEAPGEPPTEIPANQSGDGPDAGEALSDEPVYTLPKKPVSESAEGSSKAGIAATSKIECGSATGTITITYRRWNEKWW